MVVELTQQETPSTCVQAKVCGNCVHSGWGSNVAKGRLANEANELGQALKLHANRQYLSVYMVKTMEALLKMSQWTTKCEKENTRVKLLEPGCSAWAPNCTMKTSSAV